MEQVIEGSHVSSPSVSMSSTTTVTTATTTQQQANNFLASLAPAPTPSPLSTLFAESHSNAMDIDMAASMFPATPSSPLTFSPSFQMSLDVIPPPKVTPTLTPKESPRKEDTSTTTTISAPPLMVPAKRGYKSHVPSACINCKKAHLACDVSRPCKRCVALGKTDTCQDIKHKKRGRPRLRDKQASGDGKGNGSGYEVMYGTIQTPSFTTQRQQPSSSQSHFHQIPPRPVVPLRSSSEMPQQTTTISFIHEPIESFQDQDQQVSSAAPSQPSQVVTDPHPFLQENGAPPTSHQQQQQQQQPSCSNGTFIQQPVQLISQIPFDELLRDNGNMMQQYMMPPYMTMSMQQQAFSQPEQQQHAPETASLQMKMGNAFAQRPTSLPLAPTPSPLSPQQSNPHQYSYHPLAKQKEIETNLNNNISQNDIQHQQQQQKQSLRSDERRTSLVKDSPTHNRRTSMNMNKENNSDNNKNNTENIQQAVTVILSMEVCCARVSEEVTGMWGYYPQEFAHRSLYDFISPKDTDRLARLHRLLLDNIVDVAKSKEPPTQTERTTSELFHKMEQEQLTAIASGSSTFSDTLHVKKRSGEEELYEMLVCMGGGLGADLHQPASHSKLYIIAQFRKYRYEVSAQNPFESTANTMTNTASTTRFVSSSFSQTTSSSSPTHTDEQSPKHDAKNSPPDNNNNNKSNMKLGLKKNSLYLKSNPPFRHTMARTITDIGRGGPSMDMRSRSGLPAHYATSSQLNTISKFEPAKINVAPITQRSSTSLTSSWQTRLGKSSFSSSSSSSSSTSNTLYDQQQHHHNDNPDGSINNSHHLNNNSNTNNSSSSSHTHRHLHNSSPDNSDSISSSSSSSISTTTFTTPSTTTMAKPTFVSAPLSSARESNNPYASTLAAYRFAPVPSTKMTTGSPRGGPNVTHPTTQYFLQTSSSTLNAAASAAQYSSRHIYQSTPSSMADNDKASGKTDSSRKVEMSIRSLLC